MRDGVVVVHRHHIGALVGDEEQDIVHRVGHKLWILFVRKFFHMFLYRVVVSAYCCVALLFVLSAECVGVCCEGDLRVDDDTLTVCAGNHHIGAKFVALFTLETLLAVVFNSFAQPAVGQYVRQHLLAPVAMHLASVLERVCEVGRLLADLLRLLLHFAECAL